MAANQLRRDRLDDAAKIEAAGLFGGWRLCCNVFALLGAATGTHAHRASPRESFLAFSRRHEIDALRSLIDEVVG